MVLETQRLILREYMQEDFPALHRMLSDPETMAYYSAPYDEAGARRWLDWSLQNYRNYGFGWWVMISKETGDFIGDCGLTMQPIDGQLLPEIGYHIYKDHWRKGYGKEAAAAVRDWVFTNRDFNTLYCYMPRANLASCATAASIGMTKIKEYTDETDGILCVYSISRHQWEEKYFHFERKPNT